MNNRVLRLLVHGVLGLLFFLSLGYFGYANLEAGQTVGMMLLNSLILAVPLLLLFFSTGILFEAGLRHRQGNLGPRIARLLYLTPRIAGILIVAFIALFALDVFGGSQSIWVQIGGFLVHAAPSIIMAVMLALAWRREWIGALVFGLAALFFLRFVIGTGQFGFGNLLLFVLPLTLVAVLFWLNWRWKAEIRAVRGQPAA